MNLLPIKEKEILKEGLKTRFTVVAMILGTLVFLAGAIMFLPSYFLIRAQSSSVIPMDVVVKTENETSLNEILNLPKEVDSKIKVFQISLNSIDVLDSLSEIINHLPKRVKIDSFSFKRGQTYKDKKGVSILISGMALDRDSLVSFIASLKESGLFYSVEIPVSNLTKNINLPFSVSIFITEDQK